MSKIQLICLPFLVATALLVGCIDSPPENSANSELMNETTDSDTDEGLAQASQDGDLLALPVGLPEELAQAYVQVVEKADESDAISMVDLAMFSTQIAYSLEAPSQADTKYKFLLQAGKAMRLGMELGVTGLPANAVGPIFYNEACALSRKGESEAALKSLDEAVENGFNYLNMIENAEELKAVRERPEFEGKLAAWSLATFESFPFTFELTDVSGAPQGLEALKGKVVIVDVWGTWCPPCRAEIPSFVKLQEEFGPQGFQMIGLNYERGASEEKNLEMVTDFIAKNGINYPCILGDDETKAQIPSFQGFPTTLFIDKQGVVRMKAVGLHEYSYLEAIVSSLLSES